MTSSELLIKNIIEFYNEANQALLNNSLNSAATLFFKALVVSVDYFIYKNKQIIPKNHSERFIILKHEYLDLYELLDKDFPLYQKTYSLRAKKEEVIILKNDAKNLIEKLDIKI
jgi:hypothetical protein